MVEDRPGRRCASSHTPPGTPGDSFTRKGLEAFEQQLRFSQEERHADRHSWLGTDGRQARDALCAGWPRCGLQLLAQPAEARPACPRRRRQCAGGHPSRGRAGGGHASARGTLVQGRRRAAAGRRRLGQGARQLLAADERGRHRAHRWADLLGAEELARKLERAQVVSAFGTVPSEVLFGVFEARDRAARPAWCTAATTPTPNRWPRR